MNKLISSKVSSEKMPVLFLPHGGGPLPLLGEPDHKELINFLECFPQKIPVPKAILMISAHWENNIAHISSSQSPQMLYDYSGFPAECYEYQYPAPGKPELANKVAELLKKHNIECRLDQMRGYDHGTFVPLMLMYPKADIPVVQLSLLNSLDPAKHIELGEAISSLRDEGVFIVGSGLSFHEMSASFERSATFDNWLTETLVYKNTAQTKEKLIDWEFAPAARDCHRREEHLLPLHVCFGATIKEATTAEKIFSGLLSGRRISGFVWW